MDLHRGLLAAALLAAGALAACGPHYGYGYGYNVPPPPAAAYYGPYGAAPGPGYIWAEGFYDLRGRNWVWERGHWARPPRGRSAWVPPRWERRSHGWSRREGYWR